MYLINTFCLRQRINNSFSGQTSAHFATIRILQISIKLYFIIKYLHNREHIAVGIMADQQNNDKQNHTLRHHSKSLITSLHTNSYQHANRPTILHNIISESWYKMVNLSSVVIVLARSKRPQVKVAPDGHCSINLIS